MARDFLFFFLFFFFFFFGGGRGGLEEESKGYNYAHVPRPNSGIVECKVSAFEPCLASGYSI